MVSKDYSSVDYLLNQKENENTEGISQTSIVSLERFSVECCNTKIKTITLVNHGKRKNAINAERNEHV